MDVIRSTLRRNVSWIVVAILIGAVIVMIANGSAADILEEDALRARFQGWGAWGPIAFVLLMWLTQPFGLPGVVFMIPASLVWSTPVAFALSWVGNMGASTIAFEVTRRVGRDWVKERIPERLHKFDQQIARGGVWPVLALRVVTGQLPPADWLLGVSSINRPSFFIGTGFGIIPGIVLTVLFGAGIVNWFLDHPVAALVVVVAILARWAVRNRNDP